MKHFIASIKHGSDLQKIAAEVKQLIPDSEVKILEITLMMLLGCNLSSTEEVKEKLATCQDIERIIEDFPIKPPDWIIEPCPQWKPDLDPP